MGRTLEEVMSALPEARRKRIERRGEELLQEYLTLRELRKAREMTQEALADRLNVKQENISRLEKRTDMMLSTLRGYVEAMGGELDITVSFPGKKPVSLSGIGEDASA